MHIGFFACFHGISRTQSFQENRLISFQVPVVPKPLVSLIGHLVYYQTLRKIIYTGFDTGGRDAHLCSNAHHVAVQTATGTVWVHRTCSQPATGCGPLRPQFATTAF